ncbi:MAG: response regulator [Pseudomonadota bacterium]
MKVLVADDDRVARRMLEVLLRRWGYTTVCVSDGEEAWLALQDKEPPRLAILDWMMPGISGPELCQRIRQRQGADYVFTILLTAREHLDDVVAGLDAGADDYMVKPFNDLELKARLQTGVRIMRLKLELADRVRELQDALAHVTRLQGLLPICMHCKRIRDDGQTWHRLEEYIQEHSDAAFSHALCEECLAKHYPED